ncbi:MAG: DUF5004 domain-containing protein [Cyclobacteriaceae bacterium]|nr:DUF5004 domain-containing protein [Cyclobacteriaceae bacterium]
MIRTTVIMLMGLMILASCETYDEGGKVKKADKTIIGTWKLGSYFRDGVDETSLVFITNYSETFNADGSLTRTYTKADGSLVEEVDGDWSFGADNKTVSISGISSINDFSDANSSLSTSTVDILRLDSDGFWYEYENGGSLHQFRLNK